MNLLKFKYLVISALLAMSPGILAAAAAPYQLCQKRYQSPPQALSIESNYRYPPARVQRNVEEMGDLTRCASPYVEGDWNGPCGWEIFNCGPADFCDDVVDSWIEVGILRGVHWKTPATNESLVADTLHAKSNVQVHTGFQGYSRAEIIRIFAFNKDSYEQHKGLIDVPIHTIHSPHCYTMAYLLGFFNGVWNTRLDAEQSLIAIEDPNFLGDKWRDAPVRYELLYNQSCKRSEDDVCLQDLAETFRQRSAELGGLLDDRWEYFWEQITGKYNQPDSPTQNLLSLLSGSDNFLRHWFHELANAIVKKISELSVALVNNAPTEEDAAAHIAQLIDAGRHAERVVLVAHSQGNLFANTAYDAYLKHSRFLGARAGDDTGYVAAKVVHVAPASVTLRGPYVLADIDLVINALPITGGDYGPVPNLKVAFDSKDLSSHKMVDTYLDEARPAREEIRAHINEALDAL